jgi:hypothetical protein
VVTRPVVRRAIDLRAKSQHRRSPAKGSAPEHLDRPAAQLARWALSNPDSQHRGCGPPRSTSYGHHRSIHYSTDGCQANNQDRLHQTVHVPAQTTHRPSAAAWWLASAPHLGHTGYRIHADGPLTHIRSAGCRIGASRTTQLDRRRSARARLGTANGHRVPRQSDHSSRDARGLARMHQRANRIEACRSTRGKPLPDHSAPCPGQSGEGVRDKPLGC